MNTAVKSPPLPSTTRPQKNGPQPFPSAGNGKTETKATRNLGVSKGIRKDAQKVVVYGPGGAGKTELASLLAKVNVNPLFIDLEDGSRFLDVARIDPTPETFEEILEVLNSSAVDDYGAVVIDTFTKAEELCTDYTLRTVQARNKPEDPGRTVLSIEGYGWGKGYTHVYEQFLKLLQALDSVSRKGKHVVAICHDCTATVPNPGGDDWIRYEPRLMANSKGMIRHRVKEWCDHLLYIGFDAYVEDGKASGSGTRTIYPVERPTHWAKSRSLDEEIIYNRGDALIWKKIFNQE